MKNILAMVAALFALLGCSKYSDFAPPPNGESCASADDCGPCGACWQWRCDSGACVSSSASDGSPCDMSIDGASGTCHASACYPDNGTTEQCYPTTPPECYPPSAPPEALAPQCTTAADCSFDSCSVTECVNGACVYELGGDDVFCLGNGPSGSFAGQCYHGLCVEFGATCHAPAAYVCTGITRIVDERDGQCERLWCDGGALVLYGKADGWPCVVRADGSPDFKQGQCAGGGCSILH